MPPKNLNEIRLKLESSCYIQDMLMFSLHNRILLRSFKTTELMQDTSLSKNICHDKLSSIVGSNAFYFLENCVSTMVQNCSKVSYVWDLCFNKQTQVHLEQLSTMVKKYLQPSMVESEKGPHKSQWNKSKHSLEIWELA